MDQPVPGQSLAQPAVSMWGAWRKPSCAGGRESRALGERGQKELVPFAHCHSRNRLCPFLLVRGA